jgi:hypothetical protein
MSTLEIMKHRKVKLVEEDRHDHDCEACRYAGSFAEPMAPGDEPKHLDLYVCSGPMKGLLGSSSVIIRHGGKGREYSSKPLTLLYRHNSDIQRWQRARDVLRDRIRVEYEPSGQPTAPHRSLS